MRVNVLLLVAALVYGLAGLGLVFAPAEALQALDAPAPPVSLWSMQLLGGALFALGMLNTIQRYTTIAGVLGRPVLLANLAFLSVAFFASLSAWRRGGGRVELAATLVLGALFLAFAARLFARPAEPARKR